VLDQGIPSVALEPPVLSCRINDDIFWAVRPLYARVATVFLLYWSSVLVLASLLLVFSL
jgi:hypothetical protein